MTNDSISVITLIVQTVFMVAYGAPQFRDAMKKKKQLKTPAGKAYGIAYNSGKGSIKNNHILIPKNAKGSIGIIGNTIEGDISENVFHYA